ncbi:hypothetical protein OG900_33655 [Streptomyces sp. NBC_00433]
MNRLFRRRPAPELPEVMAVLLDDVARMFLTRPGLTMRRLTDLGQASFQMEATDPEWSTAADVEAAAAALDTARQALLALSPATRRAIRRAGAPSTDTEQPARRTR